MPNKQNFQVLKIFTALVAALVVMAGVTQTVDAEILTLFSTPQERKIINANRYKSDVVVETRVEEESKQLEDLRQLVKQEVTVSYTISGIILSDSGPHNVWINNEVYEDGQYLEDNSHVKVISGSNIRISITTPDGKVYYANSGETIDVTYVTTLDN